MNKLTASQKYNIVNATLITASKLIFQKLEQSEIKTHRLNKIAETTSGGTPSRTVSRYYGGNIPWIKSGELNDGVIKKAEEFITEEGLKNSSAKIYPQGTLVIALYGATVGKIGILDIDAASNQAVCAITPTTNEVNTNFLFWFLRSKRQDFLKNSFGGAQPNISQKIIRETILPIPDQQLQQNICEFLEIIERRQNGEKHLELPELPPPLEEQRRIVTRVEELVGKIEEVRSLRQNMIEQCDALCRSIIFSTSSNSILTPLHELVKLRSTDIAVSPEKTYNFAGVYCFGRGLFRQQNQKGIEFSYKNLTQLKAGNFVYPKLMAWEGALGVVPPELDGCVVSPEFPVFEVNENRVLPEVLDIYFRTPSVWDILGQISTGTNVRRRRLNPSNFLEFKMPLPSMQTQEQLRKVKRKVDTMKKLREEAIKELDALLPAILDKAFKGEL